MFLSQNIEVKIIFYEKMKTKLKLKVSPKGEKGLTEQQIISRIILWCIKTFT